MIDTTTITAAMLAAQTATGNRTASATTSPHAQKPTPPTPKNRGTPTGAIAGPGATSDLATQKANLKLAHSAYTASGETVDPAARLTSALFSSI